MPKRQDATVGQAVKAARLRKLVTRNGQTHPMTLSELSAATGYSQQFISDLEHDKRGADPETLVKLATALDERPEKLLRLGMAAKTLGFREALAKCDEKKAS